MLGYDLKNLLIVLLKKIYYKKFYWFFIENVLKKLCIFYLIFKIISKNLYFWKFFKKYIVYIKILLNIYLE